MTEGGGSLAECEQHCKENRRLKREVEMSLNENIEMEEELKAVTKKCVEYKHRYLHMKNEIAQMRQVNENLLAENGNLRKVIENKELSDANIVLYEVKKRLASKDILIKQLQAQLHEQKKDLHSRQTSIGSVKGWDSLELSVANEHHETSAERLTLKPTALKPVMSTDDTQLDLPDWSRSNVRQRFKLSRDLFCNQS